MKASTFSLALKEKRLLRKYNSHLDRFKSITTDDYKWSNPLEAAAGVTHVVTSGFGLDPAIRQGLSHLDGSHKEDVPNYAKYYGRTVENTVGFVSNVVRLRIPSAIGNVINVTGDAIADTADILSGAAQRRGSPGSGVSYATTRPDTNNLSNAPLNAEIAQQYSNTRGAARYSLSS